MEADAENPKTLSSKQRREITAAQSLDSDLYYAYQLQIQEAVNASLSQNSDFLGAGYAPISSSSSFPAGGFPEAIADDTARLFADEISWYKQELIGQKAAEAEMKKIRNDLNRRIHDRAFAREILNVPDKEWKKIGNDMQKPYFENSGFGRGIVVNNEDSFKVHITGLMSDDSFLKNDISKINAAFVGGIGVAVCDRNDFLVFEVSKGVVGGDMNDEVVEVKALIEGLHVATMLGLKRVSIICDCLFLDRYFKGKWRPGHGNLQTLADQVTLLLRNLSHCNLTLVARKDVKFAFKLAQDAIVSQERQLVENIDGKKVIETCAICLEDINTNRMFSIDGCLHRYCFSCIRRHAEVKLHHGTLPRCPHDKCKSQLKTDDCKKFLTPEFFEIMSQRILEASIPPADRVYCPYPTCALLMSRNEYVRGGRVISEKRTCQKCHHHFCMNCKVPWHHNMTCQSYKRHNPYPSPEDAKLNSLARKKLWQQCRVCKHLVSLSKGCNHISCRCGHEFCYNCGAAWKNKKATCTCPLWDERYIVYGDQNGNDGGRHRYHDRNQHDAGRHRYHDRHRYDDDTNRPKRR